MEWGQPSRVREARRLDAEVFDTQEGGKMKLSRREMKSKEEQGKAEGERGGETEGQQEDQQEGEAEQEE